MASALRRAETHPIARDAGATALRHGALAGWDRPDNPFAVAFLADVGSAILPRARLARYPASWPSSGMLAWAVALPGPCQAILRRTGHPVISLTAALVLRASEVGVEHTVAFPAGMHSL